MGPIFYVMAILGCGEADNCQQVAVAPTQYATLAECTAATTEEVQRHGDIDYEVVVAQCQRAGSKLEVRPADVLLPDAAPRQPPLRQASIRKQVARG